MEKIKNAIILTVEILVVGALIIFVAIYIGASSTERSYQRVLSFIEAKNYTEAKATLENIPHYKDSSELYIYIYPNSLYYKTYKSTGDTISGYKNALSYMRMMKGKLKAPKYIDSFKELEKTLSFKLEEINIKKQNDNIDTLINDSVSMIKKGDYLGATDKLNAIVNPSFQYTKAELLAYITFLNATNLNSDKEIKKSLEGLNPNYNGVMSSDIVSSVLAYTDIAEWNNIYNSNKKQDNSEESVIVTLGMKKNDVIGILGGPLSDITISNKYGSFEKMVYSNNRILYFENNSLSAFK